MRFMQSSSLILGVFLCASGFAQQAVVPAPSPNAGLQSVSTGADVPEETPAQQRIAAAKQQIAADAKKVQAYNELANAYLRRARETADARYLKDAESALAEGLKLDAEDFQLKRTGVALHLSRHEYAEARDAASLLHRRTPDDVITYGLLAEAEIALGDYDNAEKNAQWEMNLRPNNTPALLVGAELRTLFGSPHGAIQFLNRAYAQTSPIEVEEQAWIANQIAAIQIGSGNIDAAVSILEKADEIFPHYPYTLENMAHVRLAQNRAADAVTLLTELRKSDSDAHVVYELAKAQSAAGQAADARKTYAEFEKLATDPATRSDDATHDLILLYAETPAKAAEALKIAQHEFDARQDVWTLDAYAWALYANGKFEQADGAIRKAMTVGVQSAQIFDHAGHIAQKLNRDADAAKDFELCLRSNPQSQFAADARQSLSVVSATKENAIAPPAQRAAGVAQPNASLENPIELGTPVLSAAKPTGHSQATEPPAQKGAGITFAPVPAELLAPRPSDTGPMIRKAQTAAASKPNDAKAYAALGAAYAQRARETGDVSDYESAEQALKKSLELSSTDFSAGAAFETLAEVCMGEHRFADALTYAEKSLSLGSGDLSPFAIVGDAYADMGEYEKARTAYERLTPIDAPPSLRAAYARDSRLAYLSFIQGATQDAIQLMKTAVAEGTEAGVPGENLAWLHYEQGEFEAQAGEPAEADAAYREALRIHPGDYRALAGLARLRASHGDMDEAILLYQKAIAVVPMPMFVSELGDLYEKTANPAQAKQQYDLVEYIGMLGRINQVLHNRDLALFYADHDMKLAESLELARKEFEVRHDIYTWDALAWALYKNGKLAEAAKASDEALKHGTRDALILFHAGMIAAGSGDTDRARADLKAALEINPRFSVRYSDAAHRELAQLDAGAEPRESAVNHAR